MATEKQLQEIERKVEALRLEIKERERRVNERIDKFLAERLADKKKKEEMIKKDEKSAPPTIKEEKTVKSIRVVGSLECLGVKDAPGSPCDITKSMMDQSVGAFYGSNELKEAIKDAQAKMHATTGSLQKVREYTHTVFVRKEIEHLFKSVRILTQVFNKMMDRMELPDAGESFFLDELTERK